MIDQQPVIDPAVARAFDAFAPATRKRLLAIRELIFSVAAATDGIGTITETLKWGEPAYLTAQSRSGSTIRLGSLKAPPGGCAVYFNCNTDLVDTFRSMFPKTFRYDGNRAIVVAPEDTLDQQALALCVGAALRYHHDKRRRSGRIAD